MSNPTIHDFFALSAESQWALCAKHKIDMTGNTYTTPFETARLMMFRARQAGLLDHLLADTLVGDTK